jgi:hypothetical protein
MIHSCSYVVSPVHILNSPDDLTTFTLPHKIAVVGFFASKENEGK